MLKKILIAAIVISALGYLGALAGDELVLRWILKPGTILLIILYASIATKGFSAYKRIVIAGLLVSAAGDALLLMNGSKWFMLGVFVFLVAHLFYICAFFLRWRYTVLHLLYLIPIGIYAFLLLQGLHSGMLAKGAIGLWMPIVVYVIIISCMIWSAIISRNGIAITGAILFFLSDSLLAWNMFVTPMAWAGYGVMITYYTAQFLIAQSTVRKHR
ncbi:lysoplasmalogenase [Paenibacillus sp. GCM10027628]|uniref:lysoplasmalogenase n=1 Tax=Paenibacillus sp. GCM10027628 TaxID=3273413 RepID=UPI00363D89BF